VDYHTITLQACLCGGLKEGTGYFEGSVGIVKAELSGSIGIKSDIKSSGILHTFYSRCTKFAPLTSVQDVSPSLNPNTKYKVFVDTEEFYFAPQVNDTFIVESGGVSYMYNISAVTLS
jgi:hypothetical protein